MLYYYCQPKKILVHLSVAGNLCCCYLRNCMKTTDMLTDDSMYDALVNKDSSYEGRFIAAVKTTGIFCRPTCTARKPLKTNVEFFPTTKEALQHGYRPCKVCSPLALFNETPEYIKAIIAEINSQPAMKLRDGDLRQRGIEPATIRRWFLKNHGITFHAYQRMVRINSAFRKIKSGDTVTTAAFEAGYESLSGFGESFKTIFGVAPSGSKAANVIDITRIETPIGVMFACATADGICLLEFTERRMLETEFKQLAKLLNATIVQGENSHFDTLRSQLKAYFEGSLKQFSVPLVTPGTAFQQAVWQALRQIPYATTRSYSEQAVAIQKPEAVRAVASANGMNRIAIIVPCHRVIGADGQLTGYAGGPVAKRVAAQP